MSRSSRTGLKLSLKASLNKGLNTRRRGPGRCPGAARSFYPAEDGNALIEFCIFMPLVVFMFLAAVDYSMITQQSMTVVDAATTGTRYGAVAGNGSDLAGIQAAAQSAAVGVPNFVATVTNYCACTPGGPAVSCASACASGNYPAEYDKVSTRASVPVFFTVTGIPGTVALSASSTMRVVWQ